MPFNHSHTTNENAPKSLDVSNTTENNDEWKLCVLSTACCVNAIKAKCKMCKSKYLSVLFSGMEWRSVCCCSYCYCHCHCYCYSHSYARILHFIQWVCVCAWAAYRLNFSLTDCWLGEPHTLIFRARDTHHFQDELMTSYWIPNTKSEQEKISIASIFICKFEKLLDFLLCLMRTKMNKKSERINEMILRIRVWPLRLLLLLLQFFFVRFLVASITLLSSY